MLPRIIEQFLDIKWKNYIHQLEYNRSVPLKWIHDSIGKNLNVLLSNDMSLELMKNRSLDDIKFVLSSNKKSELTILRLLELFRVHDTTLLAERIYLYANNLLLPDISLYNSNSDIIFEYIYKFTKYDSESYLYI